MESPTFSSATEEHRPTAQAETQHWSYPLGVASFLILISVSLLTTTNSSRRLIVPIRDASIGVTVLAIAVLLFVRRDRHSPTPALIYIALYSWALILSFANGAFEMGTNLLGMNVAVTLAGLTLFSCARGEVLPHRSAKHYAWYTTLGLLATLAVGGLSLGFPPRFNFEYIGEIDIDTPLQNLYSQGASRFFGMGAIACAFLGVTSRRRIPKLFSFAGAALFLFLGFLGGGRGEIIAAVVVVGGFLLTRLSFKAALIVTLLAVALYLLVDSWLWVGDTIAFQRMSKIGEGELGHRDILLAQSVDLLVREPQCLVMGCGLGYFQVYYGYEFGMYPHNLPAELVIVYGLPLTCLFGLVVAAGAREYYRTVGSIDLFILFFAHSFLVDLKSGALFNGWLVTACSLYFASLSLRPQRHAPERRAPREDACAGVTRGGFGVES